MSEADKVIAVNKKAHFEYEILDKIECGIVLCGTEIKSLRAGKCNIKDGYVIEDKGELFVKHVNISEYSHGNINNHEPLRNRKLLLHKKEIEKLTRSIKEKGVTLIPTKLYFKGSLVKMEISIGKGKKLFDKRETIKGRDIDRDTQRELRNKY